MNWAQCKNGQKRKVKRIKEWRIIAVRGIGGPSFRLRGLCHRGLGKNKDSVLEWGCCGRRSMVEKC